jgi:CDP-glycerol glycerophosphotransferase (TagB/SpsB family)
MELKTSIKKLINFSIKMLTLFIPKDKDIWLFGSWFGKRFSDNSRYLFLYSNENRELLGLKKVIWITKSNEIFEELSKANLNVYKYWSLKSVWYHVRAGVHIIDQSPREDINAFFSNKALKINLWHGFPLKKIGNYVKTSNKKKKVCVEIGGWEKGKILCTSKLSQEILGIAFGKDKDDSFIGMYPRNYFLQNKLSFLLKSEIEIITKIKVLKEKGKKIIFYLPTFRDNNEIEFLGTQSKNKKNMFFNFLEKNNYILMTKMHFAGELFHNDSFTKNEFGDFNLPSDADVYPFLKETDILITDYSSIYFDFLYLNRDIIFYPYDLEYYKNNDRGLIFDYDEFTPGNKVYSLEELENDLRLKKQTRDGFEEERKRMKELIFGNYTLKDTLDEINNRINKDV